MIEEVVFNIDIDKGSNVFDKLAALFERFGLEDKNNKSDVDSLVDALIELEITYQNLSELNRNNTTYISNEIISILNIYYILLEKSNPSNLFIKSFTKQLLTLNTLSILLINNKNEIHIKNKLATLSHLISININIIHSPSKNSYLIDESYLQDKINKNSIIINRYSHQFIHDIEHFWINNPKENIKNITNWIIKSDDVLLVHKNQSAFSSVNTLEKGKYKIKNFEWNIEVKFNRTTNPANISFVLWSISIALDQIEDVELELTEWGMGSRWARIKVFMKDIWARERVKEILERGVNIAEASLVEDKAASIAKLNAEKAKTEIETIDLERKVNLTPNEEEARLHREIDLQIKKEELRSKRIDNANKEFDLILKASQALANGLIMAEDLEIKINEATFLLKNTQNEISIKKSIDDINTDHNPIG